MRLCMVCRYPLTPAHKLWHIFSEITLQFPRCVAEWMNGCARKPVSQMNLSSNSIKVTNFAFFASGVISEMNLSFYFIYKNQDQVLHLLLVKHMSNPKEFSVILCMAKVLHVLYHQIWHPPHRQHVWKKWVEYQLSFLRGSVICSGTDWKYYWKMERIGKINKHQKHAALQKKIKDLNIRRAIQVIQTDRSNSSHPLYVLQKKDTC